MLDGTFPAPGFYGGLPYEGTVPKTLRSAVNRNSGKTDRYHQHIYWNNHWAAKWCDDDPSTGNFSLTRDVMGDEYDAWNIGYNQIFSPWSNPSTYSNGTTNISVQLYSQNGSNITIKVFSTSASGLALAPSKPQNISAVRNNHTPFFVRVEWDVNLESDVVSYEVSRKAQEFGGNWEVIGTTSSHYFIDDEFIYTDPYGDFHLTYRIRAKDNQDLYSVYSDEQEVRAEAWGKLASQPKNEILEYKLSSNFPNPFNPTTKINYSIKETGLVQLKIFDVLGKEIAILVNEIKSAGEYSSEFEASDLPSGVYVYSIRVNDFIANQKMILLR